MSKFFKNMVSSSLRRLGFRLQKISPEQVSETKSPPSFYSPTSSCQIPELASLYSIFLGERSNGFFVECGAYDGISYSNSSCLADAGWSGILIEPIPEFAKLSRERYISNPRVQVVEVAVGSKADNIDINIAGPLTTSSDNLILNYSQIEWSKPWVNNTRTISVPQRTLDDILEETATSKQIDVLIVDVEGAEDSVFKGFTLEIWCPKMIIVELAHTHPDLHVIASMDAELQKTIQNHGYSIVYKDKINTVFALDKAYCR
jgi:hypothetical protein